MPVPLTPSCLLDQRIKSFPALHQFFGLRIEHFQGGSGVVSGGLQCPGDALEINIAAAKRQVVVPLALVIGKVQMAKAVAQPFDETKDSAAALFSEPGVAYVK